MALWLDLCLLVFGASHFASASVPEVILAQGRATGLFQQTINGRAISAFLNLPYAKPPVGELRFKDPEPAPSWEGTLPADEDNPKMCHQSNDHGKNFGSEDCLYLNVYTPQASKEENGKLLDVLFVIHGGGYQNGYGRLLGPEYLLDEENVVMVTINYRLGVLGFLSLEDDVIPGNFGLKDQLLALKWTRDNIAKFGGDPDKITLVGCSAGGASVHFHVLSHQSRGLFHKAIALSGVALNPWAVARSPRSKATRVAKALGCPISDSKQIAECLKTKPADLVISQAKLFLKFLGYDGMAVNPVVEKSSNGFLTKQPRKIIESGEASDVPFLLSYMDDDGLLFSAEIFTNSSVADQLEKDWNNVLPTVLYFDVDEEHKEQVCQAIKEFYLGSKKIVENPKGLTQMFTDRLLSVGIREAAKLHALTYKSPVHAYVLSHAEGKRLSDGFNHSKIYKGGAVHADDFAYVFKFKGLEKRTGDPKEDAVSKILIKLWMDFIKGTTPTEWQPVLSGLPDFGYFLVAGSELARNGYWRLKDSTADRFWKSLPLRENRLKSDRSLSGAKGEPLYRLLINGDYKRWANRWK